MPGLEARELGSVSGHPRAHTALHRGQGKHLSFHRFWASDSSRMKPVWGVGLPRAWLRPWTQVSLRTNLTGPVGGIPLWAGSWREPSESISEPVAYSFVNVHPTGCSRARHAVSKRRREGEGVGPPASWMGQVPASPSSSAVGALWELPRSCWGLRKCVITLLSQLGRGRCEGPLRIPASSWRWALKHSLASSHGSGGSTSGDTLGIQLEASF